MYSGITEKMEKSKTIWRILLHLLFWAGFFYIFMMSKRTETYKTFSGRTES